MKTHIIYMSSDEFSVEMKNQTVSSLEKFNIEYELFDGILGRNGINVLKSFGVAPSAHVKTEVWTDGTIGCLASHYMLWQECAKSDQPFMILEQDAILVRDPMQIIDQIESVCHLDAYLPFENILSKENPEYNHLEIYDANIEKYEPGVKKYPFNTFYENNKITGSVFRGAYGYIMTPNGAKQVLEFIKKHGAFPADACLCQNAAPIQRSNSTYVRLNPFFKSLDIQRDFSSRKPTSI